MGGFPVQLQAFFVRPDQVIWYRAPGVPRRFCRCHPFDGAAWFVDRSGVGPGGISHVTPVGHSELSEYVV